MNVVVFACEAKGLSSLNSIAFELNKRGHNLFFMYSQTTQLAYPTMNPNSFERATNVDSNENIWSDTLGCNLPFKPDWLIINREKWPPENQIIMEFKQKFNCKVGLVEANSWLGNAVESFLETLSRNTFVSFIDVYFGHSSFAKKQKQLLDFKGNDVVVGNPKYDLNLMVDDRTLEYAKSFYGVDNNRETVLYYTLINSNRAQLFEQFKKYKKENPDKQYFIKPYPGEPFNPLFKNDYFPKFFMDGVTPILEETMIWPMLNLCDTHVGAMSSVFYGPLKLNKTIVDFSKEIRWREDMLDPTSILMADNSGVETGVDWVSVLRLNTKSELEQLLRKENIDYISQHNDFYWDIVDKKDRNALMELFDDFNDGQASVRIVDYLENF
jgi:hypothetical protein